MQADFDGFPPSGIQFLKDLEADNTKEWFQAHRSTYDSSVRQPMIALLEALNEELEGFAPAYRIADPRKAVSRPNRDTRFSADKSPYRTEITAVLPRSGGSKDAVAGFFLSVAPAGVEVLGGAYMPGTPALAALRAHLAQHEAAFREVVDEIEATDLVGTLRGEQLKRVPRPFPSDSTAADLVRYKQLYFLTRLEPSITTTAAVSSEIVQRFRVMAPFVEMLDRGLAEAQA